MSRWPSRTDRADLGWSFIGFGVLAQCLLCSALTFAGLPTADGRAAHTAEVVLSIAAGGGVLGIVVGIWMVVRHPS